MPGARPRRRPDHDRGAFAGVLPALRLSRTTLQSGLASAAARRSHQATGCSGARDRAARDVAAARQRGGLLLRTIVHLAGVDPASRQRTSSCSTSATKPHSLSFGGVDDAARKAQRAERYRVLDDVSTRCPACARRASRGSACSACRTSGCQSSIPIGPTTGRRHDRLRVARATSTRWACRSCEAVTSRRRSRRGTARRGCQRDARTCQVRRGRSTWPPPRARLSGRTAASLHRGRRRA